MAWNPMDKVTDALQTAGRVGGKLISEGAGLADKALPGDSELLGRAVEPIVGLLDSEEPAGTDGGSSNWAAWGHPEIREMLDSSVAPEDIHAGAQAWSGKGKKAADIVTGLVSDLDGIVTGGWRGDSARAAVGSLGPIADWSSRLGEAVERTNRLMGASGEAAGQAKATVPQSLSHDWGGSLRSFATGGTVGSVQDAVAQDNAQSEAHAQAVQIMTRVYSAPINDNRAAVPVYPQLVDPTLRPPEPSPDPRPVPQPWSDSGVRGAGGGVSGGGGGESAGGAGDGDTPYQPAGAGDGGGDGVPVGTGGQGAPFQPGAGGGRSAGGQGGGTAGGGEVPMMPPAVMGGGAVGGAGAGGVGTGGAGGSRFGGAGGGRVGGAGGRFGGGGAAGGPAGFGPRGSGGAAGGGAAGGGAAQGVAGRGGAGGGVAGARGGMGGGMMGAPAGRGRGGEDAEHERPSYLIEMNDVFNDGRKVAPPVIGEDPPEGGR